MQIQATLCLLLLVGLSKLLLPSQGQHPCLIANSMQQLFLDFIAQYGVDHVEVFPKSINKIKFKAFLENLRNKYPFEDIILVMDNLSLHKSKDTR